MGTNTSTLEDLKGIETARRGRLARRTGLVLMVLVPASSVLGIYGPRDRTVTASTGSYELSMTYASVVRSGQAVPMRLQITHPDGFDGPVQVVFEKRVFERFDFQNWYPNPASETGEGTEVVYEFDPPEGITLDVSLDARVAPTQWASWDTHAVWVVEDSQQLVRTNYTLWVLP